MTRVAHSPRQGGFTLVEIAIVLVVIGLLLGGVLKGQEMITQARIKNVINDFNGVTAAYFGYQDRYQAVPGDDQNAGGRWSTQAAANGNGNGTIDGPYDTQAPAALPTANTTVTPITMEANLFWWHLRLAGFVPGATSQASALAQPTNAVGGRLGATTDGVAGNGTAGLSGLIVCTNNLPDKIALAIDTQLDDQIPHTGTVHGLVQSGGTMETGTAQGSLPAAAVLTNTVYQETGSLFYTLCRQN